jgi:hypothetical protein
MSDLCMIVLAANELDRLNKRDPSITELPFTCGCRAHKGQRLVRFLYPEDTKQKRLHPFLIQVRYGLRVERQKVNDTFTTNLKSKGLL